MFCPSHTTYHLSPMPRVKATDPPHANSFTMHSRLVGQDKKNCLGEPAHLPKTKINLKTQKKVLPEIFKQFRVLQERMDRQHTSIDIATYRTNEPRGQLSKNHYHYHPH